MNYETLCRSKPAALESLLRSGRAPDIDHLLGWQFRGYNTAPTASLLGIRKFVKGFYRKSDGSWGGYNVKIKQGRFGQPWTPLRKGGETQRHAYYAVHPVDQRAIDNRYPQGLLLDYGKEPHALLDPSGVLRDYIVQVTPDDPTLLLGKAYLAFGSRRVAAGYFVLERMQRAAPWR